METKTSDTVFAIPGSAATGGLPYITKPENATTWPSPAAAKTAFDTIAEIYQRGYTGVDFSLFEVDDEHMMTNLNFNQNTPEGRVASNVLGLAREGIPVPATQAIEVIERIYREQGLPLATNKNARM
jgi:hypothetical protein